MGNISGNTNNVNKRNLILKYIIVLSIIQNSFPQPFKVLQLSMKIDSTWAQLGMSNREPLTNF